MTTHISLLEPVAPYPLQQITETRYVCVLLHRAVAVWRAAHHVLNLHTTVTHIHVQYMYTRTCIYTYIPVPDISLATCTCTVCSIHRITTYQRIRRWLLLRTLHIHITQTQHITMHTQLDYILARILIQLQDFHFDLFDNTLLLQLHPFLKECQWPHIEVPTVGRAHCWRCPLMEASLNMVYR